MDVSMQLVFTQILVILLYMAVGFGAGKAGLIRPEQRKYLSGLCSNLILPFTILSASAQAVTRQTMTSLLVSTALAFALLGGVTLVSLACHRAKGAPRGLTAVSTGLLTYPNCTFLGLPLCRALFGEMAVLYNAAMLIAFNVLFFSVQYSLFTGQGMNPKNLLTPSMLATVALIGLLAAGLHFPSPVQTICAGIGGMISPLSLMIIGVMLSESRLSAVLGEKRAYGVALLRNLVIPLAVMPVLRALPIGSDARLCMLVYIACPCATLNSIYAIKCDMEPEYCAHAVLFSTLFFAATLPAIIAAGQAFL